MTFETLKHVICSIPSRELFKWPFDYAPKQLEMWPGLAADSAESAGGFLVFPLLPFPFPLLFRFLCLFRNCLFWLCIILG